MDTIVDESIEVHQWAISELTALCITTERSNFTAAWSSFRIPGLATACPVRELALQVRRLPVRAAKFLGCICFVPILKTGWKCQVPDCSCITTSKVLHVDIKSY